MFKKRASFWLAMCVVSALLSLAFACGGGEKKEGDDGGTPAASTGPKYTGPTGSMSGKVAFIGTAPEPKKIDSSADPACGKANAALATEDVVVKDGKLANVFVYVKDGATADGKKIADFSWDTPSTAAALDQNGCHYKPHVMGVMVNQKISITNSDPSTFSFSESSACVSESSSLDSGVE